LSRLAFVFVPLRPIQLEDTLIGQTLPWDLYTASGVLVASAGTAIADPAQLARLTVRPLFRQATPDATDADLARRLRNLMDALPATLEAAGTASFEPVIRGHARELVALVGQDHDACMGLIRLLPMRDPAARHCLLTAVIAIDLGHQIGLAGGERESAIAATLTMNVAAMGMHADLADGRLHFIPEVRAELRRHPDQGLELLRASGIYDPAWLDAVHQHHENLDGSGYPRGLREDEISVAARLIRVADFYAAKISGRHYRPPRSTKFALKQLFGSERGRLDHRIAQHMLRRYGLYPPGTLVRLANREVAAVLRREGNADTAGHVMAFMEARGRLLKEPVERDTASVSYAVLGITDAEPHWPEIGWETYWGYRISPEQ
jgi:HD-GYP domain-containing protein (c-di-GMP phosphodiesterase class II)